MGSAQKIFIGNGEEGVSQEALALAQGSAAFFSIKGPKRKDQRDAMGLLWTPNGELAFCIADGTTLDAPDSAELAAFAVRTSLNQCLAETNDPNRNPLNWNQAAAAQVYLQSHNGKKGAATLLSGVIPTQGPVQAHIVGDPNTGIKNTGQPLSPFFHPALLPQIEAYRGFGSTLARASELDEDLQRAFLLAHAPFDPKQTGLRQCTHFASTARVYPIRRWSANFTLNSGTWLILGSDGLGFRIGGGPWMSRLENILAKANGPQDAVQQMVDILEQVSPDNVSALVIQAK